MACPDGKVLGWSGTDVECVNPTSGVTATCPAGQVMTGIANGQPVCAQPSALGMGGARCGTLNHMQVVVSSSGDYCGAGVTLYQCQNGTLVEVGSWSSGSGCSSYTPGANNTGGAF